MRYWFGKHCLSEVDVVNRKHGRRHWVRRSREGREVRDSDCGALVITVGMGTGYQLEAEVVLLSYCNGEEGCDGQKYGWVLVRLQYNGQAGVLKRGIFGEEDFPLCLLEV